MLAKAESSVVRIPMIPLGHDGLVDARQEVQAAVKSPSYVLFGDAMPAGGFLVIAVQVIDVQARRPAEAGVIVPGKYVELSVTDTGEGMSGHTRRHAFEPFFTTKPVGEGVGLGLASVLGVVQQSGGRVVLESAPGRGTTVAAYFPWASRPLRG